MGRRSLLVAGAALLLAACGGTKQPAPDLAFVTSRDGAYSIYLMSADGDGESQLTEDGEGDSSSPEGLFFQIDPAWSPDGDEIAFASKRGGSFDIFVVAADGTRERQLTRTSEDDSDPSWSPDGKRIVFQRGDTPDIYVMDADGGNARLVSGDTAAETDPAWSPDGRWIAYQRREPGTPIGELWLVRPEGSGRRQLTRLQVASYEPAWSPNGQRIAFASRLDGQNFDIYTTGLDGKDLERLTDSSADEFEPSWSPDGKEIAFNRDGAIVVIEPDGGERELTDGDNNDTSPVWRPTTPP
jgi:Tol biopolymer transport system component